MLPCIFLADILEVERERLERRTRCSGFLSAAYNITALALSIQLLKLQSEHPDWCLSNADIIRQTSWVNIIIFSSMIAFWLLSIAFACLLVCLVGYISVCVDNKEAACENVW